MKVYLQPTNLTFILIIPASMMYQYFVKIVPTIYVKGDGEVIEQLLKEY